MITACLLVLAAPSVRGEDSTDDAVDLVGTWHVLIHYRDSDAANPDVMRWDDRLWVFQRKGSRLAWTEYPIVVFTDRDGRFERSRHGQRRVLHAWEPNAAQQAQIEAGLEFNTLGSKKKTLRRKRDGSWQSTGAALTLSASVIGYHEIWSILGLDEVPTFVREDVLGSVRAESVSGRTEYRGSEIDAEGSVIRGEFARDESRRGSFRLTRSGDAASVGTKRTLRERIRDSFDPSMLEPEDDPGKRE